MALQRHAAGGAFAVEAGPLGLMSSGGRPLPEVVRGKMEAALGADFSGVRVYVGPQAERIGAIAFTVGSDIYFAAGRYQPETIQGQQLLGHELAHVVQQRAGRVRNPLGSGLAVVQDRALEAEADRLGQRAATHPVAAQAKFAPAAAQLSSPVRISPPIGIGASPASYRLTAGAGGREVGSVMVHARDKGALEMTDLSVAAAHRGHGIGQRLVASAARAGQQFGKSKVTLAAQDKGSGHLTRWYKGMGFAQVGVNRRGFPQLEAPISRLLSGAAQPKLPGFQAQPGKLTAQLFARSATLQRAQARNPMTDAELRFYLEFPDDFEKLHPTEAERKRFEALQKWDAALKSVKTNKGTLSTWQYDGDEYHITTKFGTYHVTKDGNKKEHYFFEGTGAQIKSKQPTKKEKAGKKLNKGFDKLPPDLQEFIKTHFTKLL